MKRPLRTARRCQEQARGHTYHDCHADGKDDSDDGDDDGERRHLVLVLVLMSVLVLVQVQVQVLVKLQFEQTPPEQRQSKLPKCPTIEPLPVTGSDNRFKKWSAAFARI